MLHVFGQQPILPIAERSIRDDCAAVLADLEYANLPGEALRLRRGAELTPLHGILRDDYMYRFWWHEMKLDGVTVGIVALYGFVDWVLSPRIRRLLNSVMPMLATGINNAAAVEGLRLQSDKDELTGLLNQRGIFETLDRECARSTQQGNNLAVLLCELEDMDEVYGTMEGEAVLQAFSEVALNTVRDFDVIGRLAETEFALILPDADSDIAKIISNQVTAAARSLTVNGVGLNISVGIATYNGGTADGCSSRPTKPCLNPVAYALCRHLMSAELTRPRASTRRPLRSLSPETLVVSRPVRVRRRRAEFWVLVPDSDYFDTGVPAHTLCLGGTHSPHTELFQRYRSDWMDMRSHLHIHRSRQVR